MSANTAVYEKITAKLVAAIQAGGPLPWEKGFRQGVPRNAVTGRPYSGINVWVTMLAAEAAGYETPGWVTFNQAREAGLSIRRGERSTPVLYMNRIECDCRDDFFYARAYALFNLDQLAGDVTALKQRVVPTFATEPLVACAAMVTRTEARIAHNATYVPAYDWVQDSIFMPLRTQYVQNQTYYATLFHELGHWTGHVTRLNRNFNSRFGEHGYATEELVAELTAAYLSGTFGFDVISQSAAYLQSWLKALAADVTVLVAAASASSRAADFLLSPAPVAEVAV